METKQLKAIPKSIDTVFVEPRNWHEIIANYLSHCPIALAIRELNRVIAYIQIRESLGLTGRIQVLDVGCGDGHWWRVLPNRTEVVSGIDISSKELGQATVLDQVALHDIAKGPPFKNQKFDLAVGNCSLEHVPDIHSALANINRTLTRDGYLVMFVPKRDWALEGHLQSFLMRFFPRLPMTFSGAINGFFQHWHLYDRRTWQLLVEDAGFDVLDFKGLGNAKCEFGFRAFLFPAFASFLFKQIFRIYPEKIVGQFVPSPIRNAAIRYLRRILQDSVVESSRPDTYEYAIVARKCRDR